MAGGAAGSLARYLITLRVNEHYTGRFPLATFLINVTGSFLIGLLLVYFDRRELMHPNLRPFIITGILGGFTTFSSFEWETFALSRHTPPLATVYALGSVIAGFLACWLGEIIGRG